MIFGAIGLWGVLASSARAARWYLWTWPPRYLVGMFVSLMSGWTVYKPSWWLVDLFRFLYYTKASGGDFCIAFATWSVPFDGWVLFPHRGQGRERRQPKKSP